jgi:hypothetical protein
MTDLKRELVDAVGEAFNANDIEAVMRYFAAQQGIKTVPRKNF